MLNYRHPDPRRVWKVGSEQQSMTPDPRIPRIPRIPRDPEDPEDLEMSSQPMIPFEAVLKKSLGWRYRGMFFLLFHDSFARTPTCETISERGPSKNALKTYDSA